MQNEKFKNWLKLREQSEDEYKEKLCYCGHTHKCSCADPDEKTFEESVQRKVLNPEDPENGWNFTIIEN